MAERPLTIALTKQERVLDECLPMLAAAGIEAGEPVQDSRRLIFPSRCGSAQLVVVRGADVPTYVEYGAADIGITGKDILLERNGADYYERLDLGVARCRIVTAAPKGARPVAGTIRVATSFVNLAQRHFAEQGRQVEIIELRGAVEIAPAMGLADVIVDIVETGGTLRANGLEVLDCIAEISTRVIVNRASLKMKFDTVEALLSGLRCVVDRRGQRP